MEKECKELASIPMPYTGYRRSAIGEALSASLEEMRFKYPGVVKDSLIEKVLVNFDSTMAYHLENSPHSRLTIQARKLKTYTCLDDEWVLKLRKVEVRENYQIATMEKVTVFAGPSRNARKKNPPNANPLQ